MTHEEAYPRLAELVGVRAADVDESALRAHVSNCGRCATRLRELERVERILQSAHGERRHVPRERLAERVLAIPALNAPDRKPTTQAPMGVSFCRARSQFLCWRLRSGRRRASGRPPDRQPVSSPRTG